jgi:hypothetical protein
MVVKIVLGAVVRVETSSVMRLEVVRSQGKKMRFGWLCYGVMGDAWKQKL